MKSKGWTSNLIVASRRLKSFEVATRTSNLIPFHPIWENDTTKSIEKEKLINNGFFKYVEFWKMGMCKDETYARKLGPYLNY
jgi:hypothetical protein